MAKKITVLEPTSSAPGMPELDVMKREKVAAYARVSTDHEEQQSSLAAQTDYYKKKILANPGWEFAGIPKAAELHFLRQVLCRISVLL